MAHDGHFGNLMPRLIYLFAFKVLGIMLSSILRHWTLRRKYQAVQES